MDLPPTPKIALNNFLKNHGLKTHKDLQNYFDFGDYYEEDNLTDEQKNFNSTVRYYLKEILAQAIDNILRMGSFVKEIAPLYDKDIENITRRLLALLPELAAEPRDFVFEDESFTYNFDSQIVLRFLQSARMEYAALRERHQRGELVTKQLYEDLTIQVPVENTDAYRLFAAADSDLRLLREAITPHVFERQKKQEAEFRKEYFKMLRDYKHAEGTSNQPNY